MTLTSGFTYVFGELAPLQAIRDPYGNTLTLTRASGQTGNITKITSPHGRWVKLSYDGSNRITEVTDNGGQHLKYEYASGLLAKMTDPAGRETEYAYNGSGQMTSVTNARGNKYLQTAYDANGRVEKQTDGDGGTFEFAYKLNGEGKVESTTLTEPRGNKRKVAFNSEGFPTSETVGLESEDEATTSFERQATTGLLLSTTDPLGRKTAFEYDSNGNVTELTRLAGTGEAATRRNSPTNLGRTGSPKQPTRSGTRPNTSTAQRENCSSRPIRSGTKRPSNTTAKASRPRSPTPKARRQNSAMNAAI